MILTAKDRVTGEVPMTGTAGAPAITVDPAVECQTLLGFGGAFTEAAGLTFQKLGRENQKKILKAYFDPDEGIGYSLGRVHIASCDFSETMHDYLTGEDTSSFDISRDEENGVFPLYRAAVETRGAPIKLLATPWSPPAFMKDNNNRKHGGRLLAEYAPDYAKYIVTYLKAAAAKGLTVEFLSVQNEPEAKQTWDSCLYTPEEESAFVKNHLGPALKEAGLGGVKLLVHDHNRDILLKRALPIYSDKEASAYIWGAAVHWYVSERFEESGKLREAHPDKHLLFTEGCVEGGPAPGNWANGERYARNIIGDLSNWVEGWIEWNLILNAEGGPNHVKNYCCAPILCDTETDTLTVNPSFTCIGHFSKYIKPGAVRVRHTSANPALKILAAKNPGGETAAVLLNESDHEQAFTLNGTAGTMPPHSIATVVGI
jgi:glucosylceramidase